MFSGFGEDSKAISDKFDSVAFAIGCVIGVLPDAPADMNEIAFLGLRTTFNQSAEKCHLVPMSIGDPFSVVLAVVIRRDRNLRHLVMFGDFADATDNLDTRKNPSRLGP